MTTTSTKQSQPSIDCERLVQAIRSHLGRIKDIDHPAVKSARVQLQRELQRAHLK